MPKAEFWYWWAKYRIEPWGDEWSQTRAIAAASLAPWNKHVKPAKFFPNSKPQQSTIEMESQLNVFARRHNERVRRKRGQQS